MTDFLKPKYNNPPPPPCTFCNKKNEEMIFPTMGGLTAEIRGNELVINYSAYSGDSDIDNAKVKINYCPQCGRKL